MNVSYDGVYKVNSFPTSNSVWDFVLLVVDKYRKTTSVVKV